MSDMRICFIGDSFVNGTGDPEKLGWTGRLCAWAETPEREVTCYNLGIRRNTSEDILARWENECIARLNEMGDTRFVFSFGVNDCIMENGTLRVAPGQSLANARVILAKAAAMRPTLMIGPPPIDDDTINGRIRSLDTALSDLCKELDIPYLSVFETLLASPLWKKEVASNDGAHPKAAGYAYLAERIHEWKAWWF